MTIRSTNVYEERSLGIFNQTPDEKDEEPELSETRIENLGKYFNWHLHRQLSIGKYNGLCLNPKQRQSLQSLLASLYIWWLVWSVFLVCIIGRRNLLDEDKKWFDILRVMFELVSAFGRIGLLPTVGRGTVCTSQLPLSKLIIIIVMVRGRH